ncbi:DUF115 domain-containing protein [bacterium AH-315-F18]|nr:DUF115 domain-containing protein [bacterium AH-315-F18]
MLQKRLAVLAHRQPGAAAMIQSASDPPGGRFKVVVDGSHEAEQLLSSVDWGHTRLMLVVGLGMGYVPAAALAALHPEGRLVVLEPDVGFARWSLEHAGEVVDVALADDRLVLLTGEGEARWRAQLPPQTALDVLERAPFHSAAVDHALVEGDPRAQDVPATFLTFLVDLLGYLGNDIDDTLTGFAHALANLEVMEGCANLGDWQGRLAGVPAVCVAAGPSLDLNIEALRGLEHRAVIIAADTILEKLQQLDICPHFVTRKERTQFGHNHYFARNTLDARTVLVGHMVMWPDTLAQYPGPALPVSTQQPELINIIARMADVPVLGRVESVAHLSYHLARFLGCDPVILVGQDLAFGDDGRAYSRNTVGFDGRYEPTDLEAPGWHGGKVATTKQWQLFREVFQHFAAADDGRLINATEGGAHIAGAQHLSLAEALAAHATEERDLAFLRALPPQGAKEKNDLRVRVRPYVEQLAAFMEELDLRRRALEETLARHARGEVDFEAVGGALEATVPTQGAVWEALLSALLEMRQQLRGVDARTDDGARQIRVDAVAKLGHRLEQMVIRFREISADFLRGPGS